mgnify:CR=1 FL=1
MCNEQIRSIKKEATETNSTTDMVFFYTNSTPDYLFRPEQYDWQHMLPDLTNHYINTKAECRLAAKRLRHLVSDIADREAYVAGPPVMVERTEELLLSLGMPDYRMHADSFDGY